MMDYARTIRGFFLILIVLSSASLAQSYVATSSTGGGSSPSEKETVGPWEEQYQKPIEERAAVAPPRKNSTVFTGYDTPIVVLNSDGKVAYFNDSHHSYWDVDPAPNTTNSVVYSATDTLTQAECGGERRCTRNVIERLNLTTGETTILYSRVRPGHYNNEWHDVDPVNETHYLVADMAKEMVFLVDTRTGMVEWAWQAQNALPVRTGGSVAGGSSSWPEDWTHLNDVELLPDGRVMVSLRNFDQVVFINRSTGVQDDWTLGENDNSSILYEQHNPDYIPPENGGPAVIIADSENNRIVEYQRENGDWNQTWEWSDTRLQWPRDADRLPNGNTLISDVHGDRLLEVNSKGDPVWSVNLPTRYTIYEAERLGTGDESAGGPSAQSLVSQSKHSNTEDGKAENAENSSVETSDSSSGGIQEQLYGAIKSSLPTKLVNGLLFIVPDWVGPTDLIALAGLFGSLFFWATVEIIWLENPFVEFRMPVVWR